MRVKFEPGQQRVFLERVEQMTKLTQAMLAGHLGVCTRTIRDWRREKWQMDDRSLDRMCELAQLPKPSRVTLLPEHWSTAKASRLGGQRHFELYGSPGTAAGRSLGGSKSQQLFRSNSEYFRSRGVVVRKTICKPSLSADLAEFTGIVLGDGSIRHGQVTISCYELDRGHAEYIRQLITRLFEIEVGMSADSKDHTVSVVASSVELVEFLNILGLQSGNKVKQQVDLPSWIWQKREFQVACLRGLMDTDGCVYRHAYRVNGKVYTYTKLAFTNYSRPLLSSTKQLFENLDLFPTIHKDGRRLYLHNTQAVQKYFTVVGTNNPRYLDRSRNIFSNK